MSSTMQAQIVPDRSSGTVGLYWQQPPQDVIEWDLIAIPRATDWIDKEQVRRHWTRLDSGLVPTVETAQELERLVRESDGVIATLLGGGAQPLISPEAS